MTLGIATQLAGSLGYWVGTNVPNLSFKLVNFFSFFSVDSNLLGIAVLAIGVVFLLTGRDDPRWFAVCRVAVAASVVVTGILYNALERGNPLPPGVVPWANEVMHVVAPLYFIVDWLFAPGRRRVSWRALVAVVALLVVWTGYTMVRGLFAVDVSEGRRWYPYSFVDPTASGGYLTVSLSLLLLVVVAGLVGCAAIWYSRRRSR
jgi:hypothetical protein